MLSFALFLVHSLCNQKTGHQTNKINYASFTSHVIKISPDLHPLPTLIRKTIQPYKREPYTRDHFQPITYKLSSFIYFSNVSSYKMQFSV